MGQEIGISQPSSSQNCILSTVTWLRAQRYKVLFPAMAKDVSLLQNIQTSPGHIQHPTRWVLDVLSVGIKQPIRVKLTSHCHLLPWLRMS